MNQTYNPVNFFSEFNNLVISLRDMNLVIEDINVRTLYFTIKNFANYAKTEEMRRLEPLSNFRFV